MVERSREQGVRRFSTLRVARDEEEGNEKLSLMNFEFYGVPCTVFLFIDVSLEVPLTQLRHGLAGERGGTKRAAITARADRSLSSAP